MVLPKALRVDLWEGQYHVNEAAEGRQGQAARGRAYPGPEGRGGHRDEALEARAEADDTQRPKARVCDDPE